MRTISRALVLGVVLLAACSKDSTAPVTPASVTAGAVAPSASATVGTALATAPTFVVKDAKGTVLTDFPVSVTVASGGGTLTGAPSRTTTGETSVGTWKLGTAAGVNTLSVKVGALAPFVISASGTAGAPASVFVTTGNNQSVYASTALASPLRFKVADQYGNGVPSTTVTFDVAAGQGTLTGGATATTDSTGNATAPTWTLGRRAEAQTLRATAGTVAGTANAIVSTTFIVDVRPYGAAPAASIADAVTAAFTNAALRLSAEIVGGTRSVVLNNFNITTCGPGGTLSEQINSIVIFYQVAPIDGVGGVLGNAGPCYLRTDGTYLPIIGQMRFDEADIAGMVANGSLNDVILHEMHHALGYGSLWGTVTPSVRVRAGTSLTAFTGTSSIQACRALGGLTTQCDSIPLETTGGNGTADVHWKESVFRSELMTGYISGVVRPLSTVSIASMRDIGYTVNMAVADPYVIGQLLRSPFSAGYGLLDVTAIPHGETILAPLGMITPDGRAVPLPRTP